MATFLLAWELGAGYGHVAPLRQLALALRERGHHCVFALRDLSAAEELIEASLGIVLQAPNAIDALQPVQPQLSYASLLHNVGYDDPVALAGRIRAWRELVRASNCDLVFADHAPTALVAARTLAVPAVAMGSGFMLPPAAEPFPCWDEARELPTGLLAGNETVVLAVLNAALARLGLKPFDGLGAIFDGVGRALLTYPELDHYVSRGPDAYLGLPDIAAGAKPVWADPGAPRLFGYLRPHKMLPALLTALQRSSAQVLVRVAGVAADTLAGHQRPQMVITDRSVDVREAARTCDAYLNYAAHGTVIEMLLAGRPGLLLADTVERGLIARRALALGAAMVPGDGDNATLERGIERLIDDSAMRAAAGRFAERNRGRDRGAIMATVAEMGIERTRGSKPL